MKRSDILEDSGGKILLLLQAITVLQVTRLLTIEKTTRYLYNQVHD